LRLVEVRAMEWNRKYSMLSSQEKIGEPISEAKEGSYTGIEGKGREPVGKTGRLLRKPMVDELRNQN